MLRRFLLLTAVAVVPSVALAQAQPKPATSARPDSAAPAAAHKMHGAMNHGAMNHGAMDTTAKAGHGAGHDMAQCQMHEAHMKMMAFYKAALADSVIRARVMSSPALHAQHQALDAAIAKMPAHGEGAMPMDCPMMKQAKPTS